MRTNIKIWALAMAFVAPSFCFISCGNDDETPSPSNPDKPVNPVEPSSDSALSPSEQKERLEAVALEFSDLVPASDFRGIQNLGSHIKRTYLNRGYDWSDVEEWAGDILRDLTQVVGTSDETETKWGDVYQYHYTDYKAVVMASNFKGRWEARNGGWVYSQANDLSFVFNDQNGSECVLKLETSGDVKKVHVSDATDWYDYDVETSGDTYIYTYNYNRTQSTIGVPEHIVITLTQGGSTVVKCTMNFNLSGISNEEFNLSKSNLTASCKIELNNGYTFDLSQVAYTANSSASISFIAKKNGTSLLTFAVSADISGMPDGNLSAIKKLDFDNVNGKNALVKFDVLGKAQIQGTVSDIRKFADYIKEATRNKDSESRYKSYLNQANSLMDVNLFYDGTSTKQATMKLEAFRESNYDGDYWTMEPTLYFYDGSSYSTFSTFFNSNDFRKTIEAYKALAQDYADLF